MSSSSFICGLKSFLCIFNDSKYPFCMLFQIALFKFRKPHYQVVCVAVWWADLLQDVLFTFRNPVVCLSTAFPFVLQLSTWRLSLSQDQFLCFMMYFHLDGSLYLFSNNNNKKKISPQTSEKCSPGFDFQKKCFCPARCRQRERTSLLLPRAEENLCVLVVLGMRSFEGPDSVLLTLLGSKLLCLFSTWEKKKKSNPISYWYTKLLLPTLWKQQQMSPRVGESWFNFLSFSGTKNFPLLLSPARHLHSFVFYPAVGGVCSARVSRLSSCM